MKRIQVKSLLALLFLLLLGQANIAFPPSPSLNQEFVAPNGITYVWDGTKWVVKLAEYAPKVNPTGGANNYLPISGPMYSGTLTGPTLNVSGNAAVGSLALPEATTYVPSNVSFGAGAYLTQTTNALYLSYGFQRQFAGDIATKTSGVALYGQGASGNAYFGLQMFVGATVGAAAPTSTVLQAYRAANGSTFSAFNSNLVVGPNVSPVNWTATETSDPFAVYGAGGTRLLRLTSGGSLTYDAWAQGSYSNGTNWIATQPQSSIINQGSGQITFYSNGGLTVGAAFTPTQRVAFQPLSGYPTVYISNNASTGLQVGDAFLASVGPGNYNLVGGGYYDGGAWVSTVTGQPYLMNQIPGEGIGLYYGNSVVPTQAIGWTREVLVNTAGLHVGHDLHVSGQIYSNATPWTGVPTINSGPSQLWLCNGCEAAIGKSGVVVITEGSYWGVTCVWALGGGNSNLIQTSRPDQDWCRNWPNWGQISVHNAGAGWYNLGNYMGYDAWFTIMMLQTRNST